MTTFFQYKERIGLVWCKQIEGSERHRSESRLCQSLIESWLYRLPPAWLVELHYRRHPSQLELCYQLAVWTSDPSPKMNVGKRRRLAPSEKYEIYVAVLTGQATQREAAERFGVDRSTVVHVCRTAKQGALAALAASVPGRPGQSPESAALAATRAEVERLRATVTEQALGLTAGPVPPRVDASVKAGLCDLVEEAVDAGWSTGRAAAFIGLDADRVTRWQGRRAVDRLADATPGGHPVHGLLAWERAAVLALFGSWGEVDRSHRKLAHRGSRLDVVHVSESTVRRVLMAEGLVLPGHPPREPTPRSPWPPCLEWKPHRSWAYDFTHFSRARRAAIAILDMVSRKWLTTLVSAEESSVQVEVAFLAALDAEDLLALADARASAALRCALAAGNRETVRAAVDDGQVPLLLAVSDNGPQMLSLIHISEPTRLLSISYAVFCLKKKT